MSEGWEILRIVGSEEEAALVAGFLRNHHIPVEVESLLFHQEPVTFGRLAEVRIRVPAERLEEAGRLLHQREAAWDADAGEGESGAGEEEP